MSESKLKTLLIDVVGTTARAIRDELLPRKVSSLELTDATSKTAGISQLTNETYHAILLHVAADRTGLDVLDVARDLAPHTPVIVLTDYAGLVVSDEAMRQGAEACLCAESVGVQGLVFAIRYAVEKSKRRRLERVLDASRHEMRIARSIQERLLPWVPPMIPGATVAGASSPAETVSGDYYDYLTLPDGRFALAIGDASGHGLGPALLMAEVRACLRSSAMHMHDPAEILNVTNDLLAETMPDNRFVTLLLMCFDEEMASITYANAGHPPACVIQSNGSNHIKKLEATGMPIGVEAETITSKQAAINAGDLILAVSDGILEAHRSPRDQFGLDRAIDVVRQHHHDEPVDIVNALNESVRAFCEPAIPPDDMTTVLMKIES